VLFITLQSCCLTYSSLEPIAKQLHQGENHMGVSFKDLVVWQKAVQLSSKIYRLTASFPPSEQFGLANQLRRTSVSIASNIAEGNGGRRKASTWSSLAMRGDRIANCRRSSSLQAPSDFAPKQPMNQLKSSQLK
jgi:hypothetical protein